MNKRTIWIVVGLLAILGAIGFGATQIVSPAITVQVYFYSKGQTRQLAAASLLSKQVRRLSESLLSNSSNAVYAGVPQFAVDELRTAGAVEILYSSPVALSLHNPVVRRSSIVIDRLLIPLEGRHVGWVVYGEGYYADGPFTTTLSNIAQLRDLMKNGD
jgi:hypothetical protein